MSRIPHHGLLQGAKARKAVAGVIKVTSLRAKEPELVINADLIELIEATPDTVITLTTGHKLLVRETPDEIIALVIQYRRRIQHRDLSPS